MTIALTGINKEEVINNILLSVYEITNIVPTYIDIFQNEKKMLTKEEVIQTKFPGDDIVRLGEGSEKVLDKFIKSKIEIFGIDKIAFAIKKNNSFRISKEREYSITVVNLNNLDDLVCNINPDILISNKDIVTENACRKVKIEDSYIKKEIYNALRSQLKIKKDIKEEDLLKAHKGISEIQHRGQLFNGLKRRLFENKSIVTDPFEWDVDQKMRLQKSKKLLLNLIDVGPFMLRRKKCLLCVWQLNEY